MVEPEGLGALHGRLAMREGAAVDALDPAGRLQDPGPGSGSQKIVPGGGRADRSRGADAVQRARSDRHAQHQQHPRRDYAKPSVCHVSTSIPCLDPSQAAGARRPPLARAWAIEANYTRHGPRLKRDPLNHGEPFPPSGRIPGPQRTRRHSPAYPACLLNARHGFQYTKKE